MAFLRCFYGKETLFLRQRDNASLAKRQSASCGDSEISNLLYKECLRQGHGRGYHRVPRG